MRNATIIASLTVIALLAGSVSAATITRETLASDGSNVDTSGTTVFAWNPAGNADVTFKGITWDTDQPGTLSFVTYGGGTHPYWQEDQPGIAAAYTDANLAAMMEDYLQGGYQSNNLSMRFTISGITENQEYRLQLLTDFDRDFSGRLVKYVLSGYGVETDHDRNRQDLVMIDFVGDSSGEAIVEFRASSGYGTVSGVLLQEVPEPATMGLLAVGGLALLRRRRRR